MILASASIIRGQLLSQAGIAFDVEPAKLDEDEIKRSFKAEGAAASDAAIALAEAKAARVSNRHAGALVIGADQILVCDDVWFDKPAEVPDARRQLLALRGKSHHLVTAVCLYRDGLRLWHHVETPRLTMRDFSDDFLADYLEVCGADLLSSVGAYQLEGRGAQMFQRIDGDYFSVLGLPLLALLAVLRDHRAIAA